MLQLYYASNAALSTTTGIAAGQAWMWMGALLPAATPLGRIFGTVW